MDAGLLQAVLHRGALHQRLARDVAFAAAIELVDAAFAQHDGAGLHFHQQQVAVRGQHHDVDLAVAIVPVVDGVQRDAVEHLEAFRQVVAQPLEDIEFAIATGVGAQGRQQVGRQGGHGGSDLQELLIIKQQPG